MLSRLRSLRRSVSAEIHNQYLDEGKGAPVRDKLRLAVKIQGRTWATFAWRCLSGDWAVKTGEPPRRLKSQT